MSFLKKGTAFEVQISTTLENLLGRGCYTLPNMWIYSDTLGRKTEIDRLLLTPWGAYCIEAKSFNSRLQGDLGDKQWMGWSGKYEKAIFNPIVQNLEHVRSLRNNIRRTGGLLFPVKNVIVVPDGCQVESNVDYMIYSFSQLLSMVIADRAGSVVKLDMRQVIDSISNIEGIEV